MKMNESCELSRSPSGVLFDYDRQPTPGAKLRKDLTTRRSVTRDGFGSGSQRFTTELTISPGVGSYDIQDLENSSLLLGSPSISKKGYTTSFRSKSPRLSPAHKNPGVPGPASYDTRATEISHLAGGDKRPSTAFVSSGNGRVPFPPPNKVPGPCAYLINHDPGRSPLLLKKTSATFESKTRRDSIFKVNDVPAAGRYVLPTPYNALGDLQWTRSSFVRFQDIGKDNNVPGPQRYFNPKNEEEYFPRHTLRSSGTYRGQYAGKLQQKGHAMPTFGTDPDRFKNSTFGRLDLKGLLPGPGAYYEDLACLSVFSPPPERSPSPTRPPPQQRSSAIKRGKLFAHLAGDDG